MQTVQSGSTKQGYANLRFILKIEMCEMHSYYRFAHPRTQTRTYTFTHPPGSGSFIHEVMANFVLHAKHRSALATPKH